MIKELQPLLDENSRIPINLACTLPGTEIELLVDESKYKFRTQSPIPYAHQEAVNKQVQTWLNDGVIKEAKTGDSKACQPPLLVVYYLI